jgi:hypothetical protein
MTDGGLEGRSMNERAVQLVKDALFLCMYGERPPGAPHDDHDAETWRRWCIEAEHFLRGLDEQEAG